MVTKRAEGVNENGSCSLFVVRFSRIAGVADNSNTRDIRFLRCANDELPYAAGVIST